MSEKQVIPFSQYAKGIGIPDELIGYFEELFYTRLTPHFRYITCDRDAMIELMIKSIPATLNDTLRSVLVAFINATHEQFLHMNEVDDKIWSHIDNTSINDLMHLRNAAFLTMVMCGYHHSNELDSQVPFHELQKIYETRCSIEE
jgi:hypothetical protein